MRAAVIVALLMGGLAGKALAAERATSSPALANAMVLATSPSSGTGPKRLKVSPVPSNPALRIDDPASMLHSGYGGALVDLFPFEGGKFHLSGGTRLFGRPGRLRSVHPEALRYLPSFRASGPRVSRRFSPTMLVGYGRVVERGFAFGIDAGVTMGHIGLSPDRLGRLNRRRLESIDGRGRRSGMNQLMRVTALYRF